MAEWTKGGWTDSDTPDTDALFKSDLDHVWLYCHSGPWSRVTTLSVEGLSFAIRTHLGSLRHIKEIGEKDTLDWWWMPLETPDPPADAPPTKRSRR